MDRRPLIVLGAAVLAAMLSFAYASVFAYENITMNVSPVAAQVQFRQGSNANQNDLGGSVSGQTYTSNTIQVNIGNGNASLTITVHPTFGQTYYRNVSYIENTDGKAYYVTIRVVSPLNLTSGSQASLIVYDSLSGGNKAIQANLLSSGYTQSTIAIPASGKWRIDIYFNIPESAPLPGPTSANVQLIYSPSNEQPPTVPP